MGVAALWVAGMLATFLLFGSSAVPDGVSVAGVSLGGLDRDTAASVMNKASEESSSKNLRVEINGSTILASPDELGVTVNPEATVDNVLGSRLSPQNVWRNWFGGGKEPAVISINQEVLSRWLATNLESNIRSTQEPEIKYKKGEPVVIPGRSGVHVSSELLAGRVASAISKGSTKVKVRAQNSDPVVTNEQAQEFANSQAANAIAQPLNLQFDNHSIPVSQKVLSSSVTFKVEDGEFRPNVDLEAYRSAMGDSLKEVDRRPVNATWDTSSGTPVVVPSVDGIGVPDDSFVPAFEQAVMASGEGRNIALQTETLEPKLNTEEAQEFGITEKVSEFTQDFDYAQYRVQNIGQATKRINNTVLQPGEIFSMNDTVGERTDARGFTEGPVVASGGRLKEALGGGVSTATTAMWTAAFYAGLEKVEQGAHLIWLSRYTPGLEATVAWGQLDLKFKNTTDKPLLIKAVTTDNSVSISMWGKKKYDSVKAEIGEKQNIKNTAPQVDDSTKCVPQSGSPGFDIRVDRIKKSGSDVEKDSFFTHYIPAAAVECTGSQA